MSCLRPNGWDGFTNQTVTTITFGSLTVAHSVQPLRGISSPAHAHRNDARSCEPEAKFSASRDHRLSGLACFGSEVDVLACTDHADLAAAAFGMGLARLSPEEAVGNPLEPHNNSPSLRSPSPHQANTLQPSTSSGMIRSPTRSLVTSSLRSASARPTQRDSHVVSATLTTRAAAATAAHPSIRPSTSSTRLHNATNLSVPRYAGMSTTAPARSSSGQAPTPDPKDYSTYPVADDLTVGQYHDYVEKAIDAVMDECEQLTEQYDDDGSWEVEYSVRIASPRRRASQI